MDDGSEITSALRAAGYSAWLVGGCVRDLLLGVPPKDYDVATSARPADIARLFPHAIPVGAHFGVMLVDGVEVATYRTDGAYADGRRPESIQYETNPAADAQRRDFTINGLFLNPVTGEILDFVNGRADLAGANNQMSSLEGGSGAVWHGGSQLNYCSVFKASFKLAKTPTQSKSSALVR